MEPKFKIGDIVRLISGGPDMTINKLKFECIGESDKYKPSGYYECVWFEENQLSHFTFHEDTLVIQIMVS